MHEPLGFGGKIPSFRRPPPASKRPQVRHGSDNVRAPLCKAGSGHGRRDPVGTMIKYAAKEFFRKDMAETGEQ